jgi:outer membrane lipoprotein-sorting protein
MKHGYGSAVSRTGLAALLGCLLLALGAADPKADEILRRMDRSMAFDECAMRVSFSDLQPSGARREIEAEIWYAKTAGTMIAFVSPPREKGKRILMIGDSMWMAAPRVSRPVRLSGKDAFMGTSFTNDDVMNLDKADDYVATLVSADAGGWKLELAALRRSLPYQRVVLVVGKDYLPISQSMYLLSGELSKTIEFSDPRDYGGRLRPSTLRVVDAMTSGASTTVRFLSITEQRVDRAKLSPERFME